jgi:hypothetical protein
MATKRSDSPFNIVEIRTSRLLRGQTPCLAPSHGQLDLKILLAALHARRMWLPEALAEPGVLHF